LPFRLVGTIVDEKGPSFALLENASTKAQDLYRVGDRIGDSRIDRIEQNNVFVSTLGVRQVLTLVLGPLESKAGTAVAVEPPAPAQFGGQNGEMLRVVSNTERQINTRASGSSMDQAAKLLGKMKLKPHATDGASDGLCVSGLGDSVMAQLSGLQDGDVIQSINGHPVPNQRKAAQVLQKARRLGAAQLELKRGQEKRSLAFRPGSW
jgi:type II secretory pathway component PulC